MYGIEFREAHNSLIVGNAIFYVQQREQHVASPTYRVVFGPHGMTIDREAEVDGEWGWQCIHQDATREDLEALLPDSFGMKWTYSDFLLAMTFFDEGYKKGYAQGEWRANERHANRKKTAEQTS